MKAGYYIVRDGERIYRASLAAIHKLAVKVAEETGKRVSVHGDDPPPARKPAAKKKPAARRTMKRNPLGPYYSALHLARVRSTEMHAPAEKARKAAKLAKSMRGADRGGAVKARETAAAKTAKFAVHIRAKINGVLQDMTLYRASRTAADRLADEMRAASYTATVKEI